MAAGTSLYNPQPLSIFFFFFFCLRVSCPRSNILHLLKPFEDGDGSSNPSQTQYEAALEALSSLITKRSRADKSNKGDRFDLLFDYLKVIFFTWFNWFGYCMWINGVLNNIADSGIGGANFTDEDHSCGWYQREGTHFHS